MTWVCQLDRLEKETLLTHGRIIHIFYIQRELNVPLPCSSSNLVALKVFASEKKTLKN